MSAVAPGRSNRHPANIRSSSRSGLVGGTATAVTTHAAAGCLGLRLQCHAGGGVGRTDQCPWPWRHTRRRHERRLRLRPGERGHGLGATATTLCPKPRGNPHPVAWPHRRRRPGGAGRADADRGAEARPRRACVAPHRCTGIVAAHAGDRRYRHHGGRRLCCRGFGGRLVRGFSDQEMLARASEIASCAISDIGIRGLLHKAAGTY